ncbi:hypothetical protein [Kitasatospora sp. NPDC050543]|uniref:hypothetical protein n=1 Tax=Kitasatospora sp. NPDC050543 TaxID=3364054 RepID=UPI0037B663F2
MNIKWNALAQTAGFSFGITVAVVSVFALGILALSRREAALEARRSGEAGAGGGSLALAGATVCFAACASAVVYGLTLIAG